MADEAVPNPAPAPAPTPTQTQAAPAPAAPAMVPVPLEQLQVLLALPGKLAEHETRWAELDRKAKEEVTQALLGKGLAEEAVRTVREQSQAEVNTLKTQITTTEQRAKGYARDTALAQALATYTLNPGAAEQLMTLLRDKLDAVPEGEGFAVRTPTFQSAADFVKERLAQKEFGHFLAPSTQGGAGGGGATPPPTPAPAAQPNNLGELILQQAAAGNWNPQPRSFAGNN